jgi:hypothetical protein
LHQECIILELNINNTPLTSSTSTPNSTSAPSMTTCPKHTIYPPILDDDPYYSILSYSHRANTTNTEAPELKTYNKAISSSDAAEWLIACEEEM